MKNVIKIMFLTALIAFLVISANAQGLYTVPSIPNISQQQYNDGLNIGYQNIMRNFIDSIDSTHGAGISQNVADFYNYDYEVQQGAGFPTLNDTALTDIYGYVNSMSAGAAKDLALSSLNTIVSTGTMIDNAEGMIYPVLSNAIDGANEIIEGINDNFETLDTAVSSKADQNDIDALVQQAQQTFADKQAWLDDQLGFDSATEDFGDALTGSNAAGATDVADAVNKLDDALSDQQTLTQGGVVYDIGVSADTGSKKVTITQNKREADGTTSHASQSIDLGANMGMTADASGVHINIDAEIQARQAADTQLQSNIEAEAQTRASADNTLNAAIVNLGNSTAEQFKAVDERLNKMDTKMDAGFAAQAALSALVPNARAQGNTQVSAGVGTYRSQYGVAAGVFHYVSDNVLLNTGGAYSRDNFAGRAGITFGW